MLFIVHPPFTCLVITVPLPAQKHKQRTRVATEIRLVMPWGLGLSISGLHPDL